MESKTGIETVRLPEDRNRRLVSIRLAWRHNGPLIEGRERLRVVAIVNAGRSLRKMNARLASAASTASRLSLSLPFFLSMSHSFSHTGIASNTGDIEVSVHRCPFDANGNTLSYLGSITSWHVHGVGVQAATLVRVRISVRYRRHHLNVSDARRVRGYSSLCTLAASGHPAVNSLPRHSAVYFPFRSRDLYRARVNKNEVISFPSESLRESRTVLTPGLRRIS